MKQKEDLLKSRQQPGRKSPIAKRKLIAIAILGVVLLAVLATCGWFGVKTFRLTRLRQAAMAAYEKKDYDTAERLLREYIRRDRNSEPAVVALANIYREFGNTGREAQMWGAASSLNPLNAEYRENMLISTIRSANYTHLHGILGRKVRGNEEFTDQELYLYVISSYRSGFPKDGDDAYRKAVQADPEAFHKSDLGRMAEFMATFDSLSQGDRDVYLAQARQSEDPVVRFEAVYTIMDRALRSKEDDSKVESLTKQLVETNYYVGTPLLVYFYYSRFRFPEAAETAGPYLKRIDDLNVYLMYAESCLFTGKLDELKALRDKLRGKSGSLPSMADYCEILIAYLEDDEENLAANVRKSGKLIASPLSRFMHLRVAMKMNSFSEILDIAGEIFSNPPFHDLSDRALLVCLDYLSTQMEAPENRKDPSQMAKLAKILDGYLEGNRLLTEIILLDQYQKGLGKEADFLAALELFPDDPLLIRIAAEFLVFHGKAEQALSLIERTVENDDVYDRRLKFLHMLALDQIARYDEAAAIFHDLVEQSDFDLNLLSQYFKFCRDHERTGDMKAMADKLENAKDSGLKRYAAFFRAAVLMAEGDGSKKQEILDMLAATPNDIPEFTFYAANRLSEADRLDEAEAKYKAIRDTYSSPFLVLVNLSEVYKAKGDPAKSIEAAGEAYALEKKSMLPAFIYAKRLSEAGRYEEAVTVLKFPQYKVNYDERIVSLWIECMHHVIEKNIRDRKFMDAEKQCKHLLEFAPDDAFGKENLEKVREILSPKKDEE